MASTTFLSVLLLSTVCFAAAAGPWCKVTQLLCSDRKDCYRVDGRCDGAKDCGDGSDEAGCDALPSVALPVNAKVTVQAQYTRHYNTYAGSNSIELLLCGSESCSRVSVFGHYYGGRLATSTWTGCNLFGRECARQLSGSRGYVSELLSGEVAVEVQRRPTELAVWLKEQPDDVVTVPIKENFDTLTVRLFKMWDDLPVQFTTA